MWLFVQKLSLQEEAMIVHNLFKTLDYKIDKSVLTNLNNKHAIIENSNSLLFEQLLKTAFGESQAQLLLAFRDGHFSDAVERESTWFKLKQNLASSDQHKVGENYNLKETTIADRFQMIVNSIMDMKSKNESLKIMDPTTIRDTNALKIELKNDEIAKQAVGSFREIEKNEENNSCLNNADQNRIFGNSLEVGKDDGMDSTTTVTNHMYGNSLEVELDDEMDSTTTLRNQISGNSLEVEKDDGMDSTTTVTNHMYGNSLEVKKDQNRIFGNSLEVQIDDGMDLTTTVRNQISDNSVEVEKDDGMDSTTTLKKRLTNDSQTIKIRKCFENNPNDDFGVLPNANINNRFLPSNDIIKMDNFTKVEKSENTGEKIITKSIKSRLLSQLQFKKQTKNNSNSPADGIKQQELKRSLGDFNFTENLFQIKKPKINDDIKKTDSLIPDVLNKEMKNHSPTKETSSVNKEVGTRIQLPIESDSQQQKDNNSKTYGNHLIKNKQENVKEASINSDLVKNQKLLKLLNSIEGHFDKSITPNTKATEKDQKKKNLFKSGFKLLNDQLTSEIKPSDNLKIEHSDEFIEPNTKEIEKNQKKKNLFKGGFKLLNDQLTSEIKPSDNLQIEHSNEFIEPNTKEIEKNQKKKNLFKGGFKLLNDQLTSEIKPSDNLKIEHSNEFIEPNTKEIEKDQKKKNLFKSGFKLLNDQLTSEIKPSDNLQIEHSNEFIEPNTKEIEKNQKKKNLFKGGFKLLNDQLTSEIKPSDNLKIEHSNEFIEPNTKEIEKDQKKKNLFKSGFKLLNDQLTSEIKPSDNLKIEHSNEFIEPNTKEIEKDQKKKNLFKGGFKLDKFLNKNEDIRAKVNHSSPGHSISTDTIESSSLNNQNIIKIHKRETSEHKVTKPLSKKNTEDADIKNSDFNQKLSSFCINPFDGLEEEENFEGLFGSQSTTEENTQGEIPFSFNS